MTTLPILPSLNTSIDAEASQYENPAYNFTDPQLDSLIASNPTTQSAILNDAYTQPISTTQSDESGLTIPNVASPSVPTTGSNPTASTTAGAIDTGTGVLTSIWSVITGNIENGVFVVLGLLLIAAGVFAFKSTQQAIGTAGRLGARAAEVAA